MGRSAARRPRTWWQFARFAGVGASGYAVNLITFAVVARVTGVDYRGAATVAFLVAVTNNFVWNRRWTFTARSGGRLRQAGRFLTVSVVAFLLSVTVLSLLVRGAGVPRLAAQAIATLVVTPLSFSWNRCWTFSA